MKKPAIQFQNRNRNISKTDCRSLNKRSKPKNFEFGCWKVVVFRRTYPQRKCRIIFICQLLLEIDRFLDETNNV